MHFCCACFDESSTAEHIVAKATGRQEPWAPVDLSAEPFDVSPAGGGRVVRVLVLGAWGLRHMDPAAPQLSSSLDVFVAVEVAGGARFHTPSVRATLEPFLWEYEGALFGVPEGAALELSVWTQGLISRALVGRAVLLAERFEEEGFQGELLLSSSRGSPSGSSRVSQAFVRVKVAPPGRTSFPPGPGHELIVQVTRPSGTQLGLDIDLLDPKLLHVAAVKRGTVQEHNNRLPLDQQLTPGLLISGVNGAIGDISRMVRRLQIEHDLTISLIRPEEFLIAIDRRRGPLGLEMLYAPNGCSLAIIKVCDGPVADWNAAHQGQEVRIGDRIVSVNGFQGETKALYERLKAADSLSLVIARPATPDSWRWR